MQCIWCARGGLHLVAIEIRLDKMLSLAHSTSALLLQPGLDVLHNHDDIMISRSYLLIYDIIDKLFIGSL